MTSNTEARSGAVTNVCQNGPLTDTIVTAVADAKDVDPLDVEPLHTAVDPDALDSMFQPHVGEPPEGLELSFALDGCEIVVRADGEVSVTPPAHEQGVRPTAVPAHEE